MADTVRLGASVRSPFGANLALGTLGLMAGFVAALIAGLISHTAGAVVAIIALLGLAAWWVPRVSGDSWRDPVVLGVGIIAASPLVPARLGSGFAGLSPDDVPLILGTLLLLVPVLRSKSWRGLVHWVSIPLWLFALWSGVAALATGEASIVALVRGLGRWGLVALAASLLLHVMAERRDAMAIALGTIFVVGLANALFGLWAYLVDWTVLSEDRAVLIGLELWRWYQPLVETTPGRIAGTLGVSSNFFGALMLFPSFLALAWAAVAKETLERVAAWTAYTAVFLGLVLSYTRASLVAAAGAGLLLLLLLRSRQAAILAVAVLTFSLVATPLASRFVDEGNDRAALAGRTFDRISENPTFGMGAGSLTGGMFDPELDAIVATPHNSFLLAAAETGAVGGLLLLLAAVLPGAIAVWAIWRGSRHPLLLALTAGALAFGVQTFSNNLFHMQTVAAWYWVAAAVIVSLSLEPSVSDHGEAGPVLG